MEIHGRDPVVSVRLEISFDLAYFAPALEIIVGILALLDGNDLGKLAEQQRKRPSGSYYADGHIMLVQHENITIKAGFMLRNNHNRQIFKSPFGPLARWLLK